jgi:superfamily II DNA/RNA helicase
VCLPPFSRYVGTRRIAHCVAVGPGSGKTLAYLLPLVQRLREEEARGDVVRRFGRPRAAIVAPSRELCAQVLVRG